MGLTWGSITNRCVTLTNSLTALSLSFLIWKMEMMITAASYRTVVRLQSVNICRGLRIEAHGTLAILRDQGKQGHSKSHLTLGFGIQERLHWGRKGAGRQI